MPPVIFAVAAFISTAMEAIGISGAIAWPLANAIVIGGIMAGANAALGTIKGAIQGKPLDPGRNVNSRQSVGSRRIIYGHVGRVGGVVTYMHLTGDLGGGAQNQYMHVMITLSGHECQSIDEIWLDDECITNYESTYILGTYGYYAVNGGKYAPKLTSLLTPQTWYVLYLKKLGAAGEAGFNPLAGWPGSQWTTAHRQEGCCAVELVLWWNADKFPNGIPNISVDVHGKKLYDPRTSTTVYSENPALCIRDFLTDKEYGMGCDDSQIDDTSVIAAANACDATVNKKSGTEPRYTCNGSFDTTAQPVDILKALAASMAGYVFFSQGQWRLVAGVWNGATVTLTDGDLRDSMTVQTLRSRRDLCNGIKGTFYNPAGKWQKTDFPPVAHPEHVADDSGFASVNPVGVWALATHYIGTADGTGADCVLNGDGTRVFVCKTTHTSDAYSRPPSIAATGPFWTDYWMEATERTWQTLDLPFTISPAMCQRIAKITLEGVRHQTTATLKCKMNAYQLQPGDTFYLTHARFGWTNKCFLVLSADLVIDSAGTGSVLGMDLQAQEWDSTIYAWDPATEELAMSAPATLTFPPAEVPPPDLSDGSVGNRGSVPPSASAALTYTSNTSSITWAWNFADPNAIIRTDPDNTHLRPVGSQAVTGLSANTAYKFYPYYDENIADVDMVATRGVGTPTWAHTGAIDRALVAEQWREDHIPLSDTGLSASTTSSGTGGGGGGGDGACLEIGIKVKEKTRGVIACEDVRVGDFLWGKFDKWLRVLAVKKVPHDLWCDLEFCNLAQVSVTIRHPFELDEGGSKRASELCLQDAISSPTGIAFPTSIRFAKRASHKIPISLEFPHTFFASADGEHWVLTHNLRLQT